ncbi:MAG: hypothetical protein J5493_00075 [Lachnospiraceae bacterium]|nr:hypothetical protein [Lachnospiraceae bacterium]
MKKYNDYMDRVKLSSEAHDRILQAMKAQEEAGTASVQKKEPLAKVTKLPWYRRSSFRTLAGATAALIVLVVGVSAVVRNNAGNNRITEAVGQTITAAPGYTGAVVTSTGAAALTDMATKPAPEATTEQTGVVSNGTKAVDTVNLTEAATVPIAASAEIQPAEADPTRAQSISLTAYLIDRKDGEDTSTELSEEDAKIVFSMLNINDTENPSPESGIDQPVSDPQGKKFVTVWTGVDGVRPDGLWILVNGVYYGIDPEEAGEEWSQPLARLLEHYGMIEEK